jgi:hypothetical protein
MQQRVAWHTQARHTTAAMPATPTSHRHTCHTRQVYIAAPDGHGNFSLPEEPLAWSSPGRVLGEGGVASE